MDLKHAALALVVLLFALSTVSYAQLGEQAGEPFFNISVGSSSTFNYSILNSGSTPINYTVILPKLNTIPHNATPTVTVTPMNGTLGPSSQQVISIRVSIPSSDKPHLKWQGILSVVETSAATNITSGAGAVIRAGVAKIVTVESEPSKGLPLIYYMVAILAVIIVVVVAVYAKFSVRRSRAAQARHAAKAAEVKAKIKGTAHVAKKSTRRKTRRKTSGKPRRTGANARKRKRAKPATRRSRRRR